MAQPNPYPLTTSLTASGAHSPLEGIFNLPVAYDELRRSILQLLDNDDLDALRQTSPMIRECLGARASVQVPGQGERIRYQADLLDRCHETRAIRMIGGTPVS